MAEIGQTTLPEPDVPQSATDVIDDSLPDLENRVDAMWPGSEDGGLPANEAEDMESKSSPDESDKSEEINLPTHSLRKWHKTRPVTPEMERMAPLAPVTAEMAPLTPVTALMAPGAPVTAEMVPGTPVTAEMAPAPAPVTPEMAPFCPVTEDELWDALMADAALDTNDEDDAPEDDALEDGGLPAKKPKRGL